MADLFGLAKTVVEGTMTRVMSAMAEDERLQKSVQRDLILISDEFEMMHSFLNDGPNKDDGDDVTRTCVRQVREMALDVEDCIDNVVHLDKESTWWRRLLPRSLPAAAPVVALDDAIARIELLKARVEAMGQRNMRYGRRHGAAGSGTAGDHHQNQRQQHQQQEDMAGDNMMGGKYYPSAAGDYGDADLVTLINKKDDEGAAPGGRLRVMAVLGKAGTMSAIKKAYDDRTTCDNFTCRAWVKLMHPFSPHEFIRSLLAQFCRTSSSDVDGTSSLMGDHFPAEPMEMTMARDDVLVKAMKQLSNQKYLVVLENVSSVVDWEAVSVYLPDRNKGSCILVHTHEREIASLCVGHPHTQSELKNYSWSHPPVYVLFKEDGAHEGESSVQMSASADGDEYNLFDQDFVGHHMDVITIFWKLMFRGTQDVFSVWGIAGAGKSFLVKTLLSWNKKEMMQANAGCFWVNISHPFNLSELSRSLLLDMHSGMGSDDQHRIMFRINKDPVQECREALQKRSCLVVLDGLRSKEEWDLINASLASYASTTKFVVITNQESVATYCAATKEAVWNIRGLGDHDSFELFKKKVSEKTGRWDDLEPELTEKARLITNKCGGIPKLIVAVADVVAARLDPKKEKHQEPQSFWKAVGAAIGEALAGGKDARVLSLFNEMLSGSFMHVLETNPAFARLHGMFAWIHSYFRSCPDYLKPCIFYLSIFPVSHPIRRRRLVRRWVAEGYPRENRDDSTTEEFFRELVKLSMIQLLESSVKSTVSMDAIRMCSCQVNGFFHEYIMSRSIEDNLVFALQGGHANNNSTTTGRHLAVHRSWVRDEKVFGSMDFSKLRSLTVFGEWRSFFVSDKMELLRVLDLEDASGVQDEDLEQIVKRLRRLKFLSVRRCEDVSHLPESLGSLKQLQTLDVRGTAICKLPKSIVRLKELQYIRAGTGGMAEIERSLPTPTPVVGPPTEAAAAAAAAPLPPVEKEEEAAAAAAECSWLPKPPSMSMCTQLLATPTRTVSTCVSKMNLSLLHLQGQRQQKQPARYDGYGIKVPRGIFEHLQALHTLGVVNIGAAGSSEAFLKELKNLTQLRKLGVSGIGKSNSHDFFSATLGLHHLRSLSVHFDKDNLVGCARDNSRLPENLQSLKLYGYKGSLSWIMQVPRLKKLSLQMNALPAEEDPQVEETTNRNQKGLPEMSSLRLHFAQVPDGVLNLGEYKPSDQLSFLEVGCNSSFKSLDFEGLDDCVEVLKIRCSDVSSSLRFSGLNKPGSLREVWLSGSYEVGFMEHLKSELDKNKSKPVLNTSN